MKPERPHGTIGRYSFGPAGRDTKNGCRIPAFTEALCAQTDPDEFYPDKGGSTRAAKAICRRCAGREECLEWALTNYESFGIWGGHSERERRVLQRQRGLRGTRETQSVDLIRRRADVQELADAGYTQRDIAEALGIAVHLVHDDLRHNRTAIPTQAAAGGQT